MNDATNLSLYEDVRKVPENAVRTITGGRLKGMTDINPMWRIKELTKQFGPCGIGWFYTIKEKRLEKGANDEIAAFVDIDLFIKKDGEWSAAIPGTGGSMFVEKEKAGLHTNDECFKMALTDAFSVACKALGFGADVYWEKDKTKYDTPPDTLPETQETPKTQPKYITKSQRDELVKICIERFGNDAGKKFTEITGIARTNFVPADKFDEVKNKLLIGIKQEPYPWEV